MAQLLFCALRSYAATAKDTVVQTAGEIMYGLSWHSETQSEMGPSIAALCRALVV